MGCPLLQAPRAAHLPASAGLTYPRAVHLPGQYGVTLAISSQPQLNEKETLGEQRTDRYVVTSVLLHLCYAPQQ